jgi:predicted nucleic acid-binding protein
VKVLLDLNVLLDVVQNRVPHYRDSAEVVSRARAGEIQALIPAHAVTTLHYILAKAAGQPKADQTVDWLLAHFEIAPAGKETFRRAHELAFPDFEDAVVASLAEAAQCGHIITRNETDFASSPVPAVSPTAFLGLLAATQKPTPSGATPGN